MEFSLAGVGRLAASARGSGERLRDSARPVSRAEGRRPARRPMARARGSSEAAGSQRPIGPEAVEPTVLAGRLSTAQEMTTRASEVERGAPVAHPEDRSVRRRRKVLQAQHYRHQGRSIAEIARLLDQAPATIKAYLYDPTGEKARAIKQRYRGTCESCGAPTSGADGKGRASRHCQRCKPQSVPRWTRELVRAAHRRWYERYGFVASLLRLVRHSRAPPRRPGARALREWRLALEPGDSPPLRLGRERARGRVLITGLAHGRRSGERRAASRLATATRPRSRTISDGANPHERAARRCSRVRAGSRRRERYLGMCPARSDARPSRWQRSRRWPCSRAAS